MPTAVQGRETVKMPLSVNAEALLASLDAGGHCCSTMNVKGKVDQSSPALCDPMDCIVHGILQARILEPFSSPGESSQPRSPALQADSLPAKPQGKPKNTGVGTLSLLQRIFLTQESNRGLLHCRRILYKCIM